jgi:adenylylsulfate kinase-like enzyme
LAGAILWLTGLPCSGKTTLAQALGPRIAAAEGSV